LSESSGVAAIAPGAPCAAPIVPSAPARGHVEPMKIIAVTNIKGGVGKTTTAVNLAYLCGAGGRSTLLWDLDPQGASTYLFRIRPKVRGGARKLVRLKSDVDRLIRGTDHEGLDLLPADFSYRHMDLALDGFKRPTRRLGRVLEPLCGDYEFIFLDCPPSISLVSESVFEAADVLLVPIIPATLSSRTFEQLEELLGAGRGGPQILAFFSMVDRRRRLHQDVIAALREQWPDVLDSDIPASAEIERMGLKRAVVASYAPRGKAALAYQALWGEVKGRLYEYASARS
jgi:cellulose biosynthesis protein BcsQ